MNLAVVSCDLTRLTMLYLALPMLFFLCGWLKPIFALPLIALSLFLLLQWGKEMPLGVRPSAGSLAACGIVALLWTLGSGVGGFGFQNFDYNKHNAIFKALIFSDWPVLLGQDTTLVYTIGYHLPAAAVGKLFGWKASNLAVFLWTLAGVWLTLLWFTHFVRGGKSSAWWSVALLALLFSLLSGMDLLAGFIYLPSPPYGDVLPFPAHLGQADRLIYWPDPPWLGRHLEWTGRGFFQYSSMTTLLYWVPQHCLPGWLGAALFLKLKQEPTFHRYSLLLVAYLSLWSFFAALGVALLILCWFVLNPQSIRQTLCLSPVRLLPWVGGCLLVLTVFFFISSSNFHIHTGLFLKSRFPVDVVSEFLLVGVCAWLLMSGESSPLQRRLLAAVLVILVLLPLFKVGHSHDMAMRGSIPALFVFWCLVLNAFADSQVLHHRGLLRNLIVVAIVIGMATPVMEICRSVIQYRLPPPAIEKVAEVRPGSFLLVEQYLGHRRSFFFQRLAADEDAP